MGEWQKAGIVLADLYLMTFNTDKGGEIYGRMLRGESPFPKRIPEALSRLTLDQADRGSTAA